MKARRYYFNKTTQKQDERAFDRIYRDLHCVTRENDPSKVLADNALIMLTNLVSMLLANPSRKICVNQDFLSDITGKESDQNSNLLKQLKDIISYKYHRMINFDGKRYNYCYVIEFSEDGEKRVSNPELFYSIDSKINLVRRGKKFGLIAEKIRASYISNIREIKTEREEEPKGSNSSLSYNNLKCAREAKIFPISKARFEKKTIEALQGITDKPTLAYGSLDEPAKVQDAEDDKIQTESLASPTSSMQHQATDTKATSPSTLPREEERIGLAALSEIPLLTRLLNSEATFDEFNEDIPMKEQEADDTEIGEQDKSKLLIESISKAFGEHEAKEILDNCEFIDSERGKVGIKLKAGVTISEHEKAKIRSCIKSVYGENIKIVAANTVPVATVSDVNTGSRATDGNESLAQNSRSCGQWEQFRTKLLNFFPQNTGQHILSAWFDKLSIKEDKPNNKITLTGSSFLVDGIDERFRGAIIHAISKTQINLELHYENNGYRPITYKQKGEFLK